MAGIVCGQLVCHSVVCRDAIGILCQRGHLLAIARGEGIYESDLQRALAEWRYATGVHEKARNESSDKPVLLTRLVANRMARFVARGETISPARIERELNLLHWQFRDEKTWRSALEASGLSARSLRRAIAANLRAREWALRQIAQDVDVTTDECRSFYEAHQERFFQPECLQASHLFVAAPWDAPPEVVDVKRALIGSLFTRLAHGEDFAELAALTSEDEATKTRGGDLGYFSAVRMPPDFFDEAMKLRIGQTSAPIHSRLGFHIIKLTDLKPGRQMTFDEARDEIALALEAQKRQVAVEKLDVALCAGALRPPSLWRRQID